jgi:HK97 family phage major capsid protein
MWDVLLLAWKQSRKAYKGSRPNAILVSIGAGVDMDLTKDEFGQYIMPQFMVNQDKTLKGVPIIEADDIADGEFLLGDFTKCLFNMVQDVTIDMGWMNDQFGKNQFTLRAELEGMQRVKSQFAGTFVKGVFATAIADIKANEPAQQ